MNNVKLGTRFMAQGILVEIVDTDGNCGKCPFFEIECGDFSDINCLGNTEMSIDHTLKQVIKEEL